MNFDKKLFLLQQESTDKNELLKKMASELYEANCVNELYSEGILTREDEYPTGLEVNGIGIAIPHTDTDKVLKSQICFASVKDPIEFKDMTDKNNTIQVSAVFMLAMKESDQQISTLQNLVELFQNQASVEKLINTTDQEEVINLLRSSGIQ